MLLEKKHNFFQFIELSWQMYGVVENVYVHSYPLKSKICFCSHKNRSSVGYHTAVRSVMLQVLRQQFLRKVSLHSGGLDPCAVP